MRLLIVEDDAAIRKLLVAQLREGDYGLVVMKPTPTHVLAEAVFEPEPSPLRQGASAARSQKPGARI